MQPGSLGSSTQHSHIVTSGKFPMKVGHAHLDQAGAGTEPIVRFLEEFAGSICEVHIADNHGATDEHLVPGQGSIHWPRALECLDKIGFEGPCTMELKTSDARRAAREAREFLGRQVDSA